MYLLHRRSATAASRSSDTYFPPTTDDHASGADGNAAALEDDWFASQPVEPALTWPDDLADHDVEPDFETTDEFAPQDVADTPQDADAVPYDAPEPTFGNPVTLGAADAALRRNFPQIPAGHCYVVSQSADVRMHMLLEIIETRLQRPFEDHDQLIVLDTHGQLSDAIANRFNRTSGHGLHNNPIVIDPHAPTTPGMLNPFEIGDLGTDSFKRDQMLNRAFEAQSYICEAFLGSAFVQENQSSLRHLIKLLTLIPGADFRTFLALLDPDNISEYEESIAQLDTPSSREFFTHSIFTREFARRAGHLRDRLSQFSDLSGFQHATGCGNSDPRLAAHIWAENIIAVRLAPDADGEVVTTTLRRIALAKAVALAPKRDAGVGAERRRMVIVDDFFECFGADFVEFSRLMRELKEKTCELVLAHATADGVTGDILDQIASRFHSKLIATSDPLTRDMLGRAMNADDAMLQNVSANASQREFLFAGQDGQWRNFWLPTEPGEPSL